MALHVGTRSVLLLFKCSIMFLFCQLMLFGFIGNILSDSFKSTLIFPNGNLNDCVFYKGQLILERVGKCLCICFFVLLIMTLFNWNVSESINTEKLVLAVIRTTVLDCTCTEESEQSLTKAHFLFYNLFCFNSLYSLCSNFDCTAHSMQPLLF